VALAERDKALAAAKRRAAELEAEVAELERECELRQAQEAALKEAVRDLQREAERLKLAGKAGAVGGLFRWCEADSKHYEEVVRVKLAGKAGAA
jgi:hypothetical protein